MVQQRMIYLFPTTVHPDVSDLVPAPAKIIDEPAIKKLPVPDNFGHRVGGELRKEKSPLILG